MLRLFKKTPLPISIFTIYINVCSSKYELVQEQYRSSSE